MRKPFSLRWAVLYLAVGGIFILFFREEPLGARLSALGHSQKAEYAIFSRIRLDQKPTAKELRAAIAHYRNVIDLLGPFSHAYGNQGFCYYYLGKSKEAIQMYAEAIRVDPVCYWYYWDMGMIYAEKKDYAKAISLLQKALELIPVTVGRWDSISRQDEDFLRVVDKKTAAKELLLLASRAKEDQKFAIARLEEIILNRDPSPAAQKENEAIRGQESRRRAQDENDRPVDLLDELYEKGALKRNKDKEILLHFDVTCFSMGSVTLKVLQKQRDISGASPRLFYSIGHRDRWEDFLPR